METIASFPAVGHDACAGAGVPVSRALVADHAEPRKPWTTVPLAALAALALLAWGLATWNDQHRLVRQRAERLAHQSSPGTIRP